MKTQKRLRKQKHGARAEAYLKQCIAPLSVGCIEGAARYAPISTANQQTSLRSVGGMERGRYAPSAFAARTAGAYRALPSMLLTGRAVAICGAAGRGALLLRLVAQMFQAADLAGFQGGLGGIGLGFDIVRRLWLARFLALFVVALGHGMAPFQGGPSALRSGRPEGAPRATISSTPPRPRMQTKASKPAC